jgi:hypothetical protein
MSRTGSISRTTTVLFAVILLAAGGATSAPAQAFHGEYAMFHEGTELMAVRMNPDAGGEITGELSFPGLTVPFTGRVAEGVLRFTTTFDGQVQRWEATLAGDALRLTMNAASQAPETHTLARRGVGWSTASPLAREWEARLTGRLIRVGERTGGGTHGGAVKDTYISFCPGGKALLEEHFALNVTVPGIGGGRVSRMTEAGWWRVLTSGGHAGVEFSSDGGESFQLGIRTGSEPDILLAAGQPVRLSAAGDNCLNPRLASLRAQPITPSSGAAATAAPGGYAAMVPRVGGGTADGFPGTYTGQSWQGQMVVVVLRLGDEYQVVMNPDALAPMRGIGRPDDRGGISGELRNRVLGMENKDIFWLRPEAEGMRFRTRGINIIVQRQ